MPATVASIEYDPNRSANIALLHYHDGEKRYILAPRNLTVGSVVESGPDAEIEVGEHAPQPDTGRYRRPRRRARAGPGRRWRAAPGRAPRSRPARATVTLRPPSGGAAGCGRVQDHRWAASATHQNVRWGKAGRKRHLGIRPTVRGTVMNPVDHPHGGGEGKSTPGRSPVTPWGKPTQGSPTRKKHKRSDAMIVRRRKGRRR